MEAIILILIICSFAWWCFSQGSKPREKSELEKRKEADARSEEPLPKAWLFPPTGVTRSSNHPRAGLPQAGGLPTWILSRQIAVFVCHEMEKRMRGAA